MMDWYYRNEGFSQFIISVDLSFNVDTAICGSTAGKKAIKHDKKAAPAGEIIGKCLLVLLCTLYSIPLVTRYY
jgi:hypothetical protein